MALSAILVSSLAQCVLLLALLTSDSEGSGEVYDFCQSEYFDVSCQENEVIMMDTAKYGRMRRGRCISGNYQMSCSVDVLPFFDSKCSGRQECKVYIADPILHNKKPCGKDLSSYVEASYTCVTVAGGAATHCAAPISLTSRDGYISSAYTVQYGLGTVNCPWIINAKEGQKITLYLYTFGGRADGDPAADSSADVCYELGRLEEPNTQATILTSCSGQRYREVYVSTGNTLVLQLLPPEVLAELVPFVLYYEATGCEKLVAPPGGWLQVEGENAKMGCNDAPEVWYMTCQGSRWIGQVSNCSAGLAKQGPKEADNGKEFPFGILIVVAIGVALGVFLGGALLTVVAVHMKGRHRQRQEAEHTEESPYQQCHLATKHAHLPAYDDALAVHMTAHETYSRGGGGGSKALADQELYNTQRKAGHVYESPQFS